MKTPNIFILSDQVAPVNWNLQSETPLLHFKRLNVETVKQKTKVVYNSL